MTKRNVFASYSDNAHFTSKGIELFQQTIESAKVHNVGDRAHRAVYAAESISGEIVPAVLIGWGVGANNIPLTQHPQHFPMVYTLGEGSTVELTSIIKNFPTND